MRDNNKPKNDAAEDSADGVMLALEHIIPEGLRVFASNHMTVQHSDEGEFTISFYDVVQPVILGNKEDIAEQLKKVESVKAHCIARIAVTAGRMPKLIGALANTYDKYLSAQQKSEPDTIDKKHAS